MSENESPLGSQLPKLLNYIQNYKAEGRTGTAGIIAGVVALLAALIAIAVLAFKQWKAGKERAKLLHEKAVKEEEAHQAELDSKLAESEEHKQAAEEANKALKEELGSIKEELVGVETKYVTVRDAIDRISSWEDVDEFRQE